MYDDDVEELHDVLVHSVEVQGDELHVDLYGSTEHICGTVTFSFTNPRQRRQMAAALRRWERTSTPLVMTTEGSTISLRAGDLSFGADLVG